MEDSSSWMSVDLNGTEGEEDYGDYVTPAASGSYSHLDSVYQQTFLYYLMGIGGLVVCSLGVVANGFSVAVLTRRSFRSSTYTYLTALAVCDSLVLVFTVLLVMKDVKSHDATGTLEHSYSLYFPLVHPTAIIFQVTSIWLTLGFTVDRYIMICHPFKAESMCRRSRARKVVVALYIGGALFCIPKFLEYSTKKYELLLMNSTEIIYVIELTEIGKNEVFREIVHSWMYLICVCGVPFLTLVVLNAFLIHAVHMSRQKGKELNAREKHRNDTTIMLIGVVVIFLICQGPALVSRMIYAFKPVEQISRAEFTLNEVANFLVILNSAINIMPYYFFGKKFRNEFWSLFCSCLFDRDELRRLTRTFSLSMDPGRRASTNSNNYELNGFNAYSVNGGSGGRGFSCTAAQHHGSMDTPLMDQSVFHRDMNNPPDLLLVPDSCKTNGHPACSYTDKVTACTQRVQVMVAGHDTCPQTGL
ncbi:hypothetical protein ACOMHN_026581 [Nucella lapillus]